MQVGRHLNPGTRQWLISRRIWMDTYSDTFRNEAQRMRCIMQVLFVRLILPKLSFNWVEHVRKGHSPFVALSYLTLVAGDTMKALWPQWLP